MSIGSVSVAKVAANGDAPFKVRPRVLILLVAAMLVVFATLFVMATDHTGTGGATYHPFSVPDPRYAVSGFLVGALVGLTGVGGGSLMTPLLVLLFRFHPGTAVGTDLLYAAATKTVGTAVHGAGRTVDWTIVGRMALGSVPASLLSLYVLYAFNVHGVSAGKLITVVLGFALMLTAATLVFRNHIVAFAAARFPEPNPKTTACLTTLLGAVLGALITLSSVGAGAIGVTVLILLYPRLAMSRVVGSDIAHAVPLTLIAGLGHWWLGSVNFGLLGSLLTGSIPGIVIGSVFAARAPDRVLRPLLAATLMLVGFGMAH
jgi:uncharacterized membrane protein YfcA